MLEYQGIGENDSILDFKFQILSICDLQLQSAIWLRCVDDHEEFGLLVAEITELVRDS